MLEFSSLLYFTPVEMHYGNNISIKDFECKKPLPKEHFTSLPYVDVSIS